MTLRPHDQGALNKLAKRAAGPLSRVVGSPQAVGVAGLLEAYWSILLGKGAGTGWALRAEVDSALAVIDAPNPVVFDVGANLGCWSLEMAAALPGARFVVFEPQPECLRILQRHGKASFELIGKAVSSQSGTTLMYSSGPTSGIASLHERRDSYFDDSAFTSREVESVTLDQVIEERQLSRVDFVKMDIEGHELRALEGAAESLERGIIMALSFEFGSGNINSRTFFRDYWDLLGGHGYRIARVLPSGRLLPIAEYYEDCEHFRGVTNYIAVSPRSTG